LSSFSSSVTRRSFAAAFFSRSTRFFARSAKDYHNTTSSSATFQQYIARKKIVGKPTISTTLMVTMLVHKACISLLLSKISSCQGVLFQSISHSGNIGLVEESGTCALDIPGPPGACSI
jgi:hypothetical protein